VAGEQKTKLSSEPDLKNLTYQIIKKISGFSLDPSTASQFIVFSIMAMSYSGFNST
jgi:hypothetical protein